MSATDSISPFAMTRYELNQALPRAKKHYQHLTRMCLIVERDRFRCAKELEKLEKKLRRSSESVQKDTVRLEKLKRKNPLDPNVEECRSRLNISQNMVRLFSTRDIPRTRVYMDTILVDLARYESTRDQVYNRWQLLEKILSVPADSAVAVAAVADAAPVEEVQSDDEITFMVRLLSGTVKTVTVGLSLPVSRFADVFAEKHRYSSTSTQRFVFLYRPLCSTSDSKEEVEVEAEAEAKVFWSLEDRHEGKCVGDMIQDRGVARLDFIIRPLEDPDRKCRFQLLRNILDKKKRLSIRFTDDELFGMYSTWVLTYQRPAGSNRYNKLEAFVEAHADVFTLMTPEEEKERKYIDRLFHFRRFRTRYTDNVIKNRALYQGLPIETIREHHLRHGPSTPLCPSVLGRLLITHTLPELYDAGLTASSIPDASEGFGEMNYDFFVNWHQWCAELDADTILPSILSCNQW